MESHLLQMRGLKLLNRALITSYTVASFTDAWIETKPVRMMKNGVCRRIFYRCVD